MPDYETRRFFWHHFSKSSYIPLVAALPDIRQPLPLASLAFTMTERLIYMGDASMYTPMSAILQAGRAADRGSGGVGIEATYRTARLHSC